MVLLNSYRISEMGTNGFGMVRPVPVAQVDQVAMYAPMKVGPNHCLNGAGRQIVSNLFLVREI